MWVGEDSEAPSWSKLQDLKQVFLTLQNTDKQQRVEVGRALRQFIVACFQIQTDSFFFKKHKHFFYFSLLYISLSSFVP